MPVIETEGLITNCFLKRNSPNEILISSQNNIKLSDLRTKLNYWNFII